MPSKTAPPRDSNSLAEMVEKVRKRDPKALETLFLDVNPILFKMLAGFKIFSEEAEDIAHQTWERFFENLHQFEGRSSLRTFVIGILINKIRERRRASQKIILEDDSEKVFAQAFDGDGWWVTPPPDPQKALESKQLGELLKDCMEGLKDPQKSVFLLSEVEQENSAEICNILGISVSHMRVLLFRAKDKLRDCLSGKLGIGASGVS